MTSYIFLGMNEKRFGTQWGGEDWDFANRVLAHGLEIIHNRWAGYWHIYHTTKDTWDGSKKDL